MRVIESIALKLDTAPWNAVLRTALGFVLLPVFELICGGECSTPAVFTLFGFVLLGLRAGPLVIRKLLRFSRETQAEWASRRRLARLYDSYQWQKLFWIGLGLSIYQAVTGDLVRSRIALSVLCVVGGALGLLVWNRDSDRLQPARSPETR
jgi:hypothetical protein